MKRLTAPQIRAMKGSTPIVALAVSHYSMARAAEAALDVALVGDSLGMVAHGMPSTLGVTLDMMIAHGAAVVRATRRPLVVIDLPFGAYEESPAQAFRAAARVLAETGAGAVKLEGGTRMTETIAFLVARGVPVMAHIGLTPQSVHGLGGFRPQGMTADGHTAIAADANAIVQAGAFAVVLEGVAEPLAASLTRAIGIPTIGIGASPDCDGQILVIEDLLGLTPRSPRFVQRYAELAGTIGEIAAVFASDVRDRRFPQARHTYVPQGGEDDGA